MTSKRNLREINESLRHNILEKTREQEARESVLRNVEGMLAATRDELRQMRLDQTQRRFDMLELGLIPDKYLNEGVIDQHRLKEDAELVREAKRIQRGQALIDQGYGHTAHEGA